MKNYKKDFTIFDTNPHLIYLDSAASALKVRYAMDAMNEYYGSNGSNVHRGAYDLAYLATNMYEGARKKVAAFLNTSEDEIVFTKGATQSINIVANHFKDHLKEGDEVIVSELEHHASLLPFMNVCQKTGATLKYVPLTKEGRITIEAFNSVLSSKTKVVSLTLVSNVLGYITPIKEIIEAAHRMKAIVVVDAAQAVSHIPIDVRDMDCDFLAFSGHKIYGPTGVGVLYGKKHLLDILEPFEFGGEMVDQVTKETATYKSSPLRLEAGTPVIGEAIGLGSALDYTLSIGYHEINSITNALKTYTISKLENIKGITLYNKGADVGIIALNVDGVHPHDIASFLDGKAKIAVRAGHHCAQLVSKFLGVSATLRISFNIYNTMSDCDLLISTILEARDFFEGGF